MQHNSLKSWLDWQEGLHPKSIDLGLTRVQQVFKRLQPNYQKPITVTVAGTNGKGSSVAFLDAIYRAQGFKVGAYTSPHILRYNERIKINGEPVSDNAICQAFERIEAVRDMTSLSYFEFSTLAALDIFIAEQVDVQLLEVGLGGRLDAVNIVDANAVIITSICIDHVDWLGDTREAIAIEKAGVLRKNVPAIVGDLEPPSTLIQCANEKSAQLLCFSQAFNYQTRVDDWDYLGRQTLKNLPLLALKGEHQYRNACSVLTAVDALQADLPVTEASIKYGLSHIDLLGRFQLITDDVVPVLLDVSHNAQAAQSLVDYLQVDYADTRIHAIFTMMSDKDMPSVLQLMHPLIKQWYISPLNNPRTNKEADTLNAFNACAIKNINIGFDNFLAALDVAKVAAKKDNGLILIFGSFFLVSEYLSYLSTQSLN